MGVRHQSCAVKIEFASLIHVVLADLNTDNLCNAIKNHEGWELVYDDAQQKQENQIMELADYLTEGLIQKFL